MRLPSRLRLSLVLCLTVSAALVQAETASATAAPPAPRYRVVILTDMTHDDGNSLIRYLYYTPFFETEAIIVTPQLPDYGHDAEAPWQKAQTILAAYRDELPQLRRHDPGFPDYETLRNVTKRGRGALPIIWLTEERTFSGQIGDRHVTSEWGEIRFADWIGEGTTPHGEPKDSEGSEFLQEVFARDDDRPIHVQLWGGPITLVQALHRFHQQHGDARFQKLLQQLHVYSIHLQDITTDYFLSLDDVRQTPCAHLGATRSTYPGERATPRWFLFDFGHFWKYIGAVPPAQVAGHGPLSRLYDGGGEGDTPAFLYLVSAALGLNDPQDPTQASWGNRFYPLGRPFPEGYFHTCPGSADELTRWLPDATSNFLARLRWAVAEPGAVNHPPVAVLEGNAGTEVLRRSVEPGATVRLDARSSYDPDGDAVTLKWLIDRPPGDAVDVALLHTENGEAEVTLPADRLDPVHLVLEVRDNGVPALVAYRRVVLTPLP